MAWNRELDLVSTFTDVHASPPGADMDFAAWQRQYLSGDTLQVLNDMASCHRPHLITNEGTVTPAVLVSVGVVSEAFSALSAGPPGLVEKDPCRRSATAGAANRSAAP